MPTVILGNPAPATKVPREITQAEAEALNAEGSIVALGEVQFDGSTRWTVEDKVPAQGEGYARYDNPVASPGELLRSVEEGWERADAFAPPTWVWSDDPWLAEGVARAFAPAEVVILSSQPDLAGMSNPATGPLPKKSKTKEIE